MATPRTSHPLRPYADDSDRTAGVFVASRPGAGAAASPRVTPTTATTSSPSTPLRPSPNRYIRPDDDVSLSSAAVSGTGVGGGTLAALTDAGYAALQSAALQYSMTCVAMPFEVAKLLLQIQWVPRDQVWADYAAAAAKDARSARAGAARSRAANEARLQQQQGTTMGASITEWDDDAEDVAPETEEWLDEENLRRDFGAEEDELSDEDEASAYFQDLSSAPSRPPTDASLRRTRPTDASGYVVRRSVHEGGGARPEHILPVVVRGGVWEMVRAVARGKEGYWGLWKGTFTQFIYDFATNSLVPLFNQVLSVFIPGSFTKLPLPYAQFPRRTLTLLLSSHLLTGLILSPIDLIRTRLVAQSTLEPHRKYRGPLHALRSILSEEGGWRTVYFHPNLLIPTLLDFTLRPAIGLGTPLLIEHKLRIDPNVSPVTYALVDFVIATAALLVTLPIETVRRRLQVQPRAPWGAEPPAPAGARVAPPSSNARNVADVGLKPKIRALRTCVETRPKPYLGVIEAMIRIVSEESSVLPPPPAPAPHAGGAHSREESTASTGASGLMQSGIIALAGPSRFGGIKSLYRGFTMGLGANATVLVLTLFTGERAGSKAGWAEI